MAGPLPVGAMPPGVPSQINQQPHAPQAAPSIPQNNGIFAATPAYIPGNAQPYRHPPFPPMDLRQQAPAQIQDARGRSPPQYRALRLEKASSGSSWTNITVSEKPMPQSMIRDRIAWLQKNTNSVTKKKQEKNESIQRQLDKTQADLTKRDRDVRFYYKLVQLESEWWAADGRRQGEDRSGRSSKKHKSHSRRNKSPKWETAAIIAYFVSMHANDRPGSRLHGTNMPLRQSKQTQQPQVVQTSAGGLPPIILPPSFVRPVPSNPLGKMSPIADPRLSSQPNPAVTQQAVTHPTPQAQAPYHGAPNKQQHDGTVSTKSKEAMPRPMIPGPTQGQIPGGQPPRLPPIQLPIRPPHVQGTLSVPNTPSPLVQAGPGASGGAFEASRQSTAPRTIVAGPNSSVRNNIKVYHASDQSSSSSDDLWSEDESEGTTPSSISSDHSLLQHGRGRSPKRAHADHHRNVIIQDSRHSRKEAKYVRDERTRPSQRQHVRFDSPDHRYQEENRSPRDEYHSQRRAEATWRVEPPRIIQVPRTSVRHVRGSAPRRDSFDDKYDNEEKQLERARLYDSRHKHDVRRENDRFKHLEEDVRLRRDLRERRSDRREDSVMYAESDSRWSDQQARDYMRQRESRPYRYHESRKIRREYDE
ncbi:uncharacterized protein B0J16DRAFT_153026 [Fusarium flagelliforme]|uniref:Uncharacterized protein n=1 Tax=Fusarium flagelliforme TaxID=2675880 RepID=A0A395MT51_9HYPO|nr:uncharacterized protein B0J16DRAFT_153026 [Fusarium flagelliforme]KAH7182753.1 hypothetical protein B0J16DRAFT_153026 [Fusarium flagelliforme]RFN51124.1 hypothetical protein FIE12Z_4618 [Fusarium flagelliforme]